MAFLLVFTGCEDKELAVMDLNVSETSVDFANMTEEEALEYFKKMRIDELESNFDDFTIDTLSIENVQKRKGISLRSSYDCEVNVELSISGPSNTADVTVYEAGTSNIIIGPVSMTDDDDFDMTINGADYYDFKVEPTGNPGLSTMGQLIVDPYYGGKTVAPFSGAGPHYLNYYNYECPEPTDGNCDVELDITKVAGNATKYVVGVIPLDFSLPFPYYGDVLPGSFGSESIQMHIDDSKAYNISIKPNLGSTYERFRVTISTPYLNYSYTFTLDTTNPAEEPAVISNFDYFDCPK